MVYKIFVSVIYLGSNVYILDYHKCHCFLRVNIKKKNFKNHLLNLPSLLFHFVTIQPPLRTLGNYSPSSGNQTPLIYLRSIYRPKQQLHTIEKILVKKLRLYKRLKNNERIKNNNEIMKLYIICIYFNTSDLGILKKKRSM